MKVTCFKMFEKGFTVEQVREELPDASPLLVYEAHRAFKVSEAAKNNGPNSEPVEATSDTPEEITDQNDLTTSSPTETKEEK